MSRVCLPLPHAALLLEPAAGGWCAVYLEQGRQRLHLGGDAAPTIASRLLANLERPQGAAAGEIDGRPVWWVLSLFERHASIYCDFRAAERHVVIRGRDGERLFRGALPEDHWRAWRAALAPLRAGRQHGDSGAA